MKKEELKKILQIYNKVREALIGGKAYAQVKSGDHVRKIAFSEWAYKLPQYIEEIINNENDPLFTDMIRKSVVLGKTDRKVLQELPLSESSYYRYKHKFENRLYELFIVSGYVTREEILSTKITRWQNE